jgi:hypothetical protein
VQEQPYLQAVQSHVFQATLTDKIRTHSGLTKIQSFQEPFPDNVQTKKAPPSRITFRQTISLHHFPTAT